MNKISDTLYSEFLTLEQISKIEVKIDNFFAEHKVLSNYFKAILSLHYRKALSNVIHELKLDNSKEGEVLSHIKTSVKILGQKVYETYEVENDIYSINENTIGFKLQYDNQSLFIISLHGNTDDIDFTKRKLANYRVANSFKNQKSKTIQLCLFENWNI